MCMKKRYLSVLLLIFTLSCGEEQYNLETDLTAEENKWVVINSTNWPLAIPIEKTTLLLSFKQKMRTNSGIIQISCEQTTILIYPEVCWFNETNCLLKTENLEPQSTYFLQLVGFQDKQQNLLANQNLQFMTTKRKEAKFLFVIQTFPTNRSSEIDNQQRQLTIQFSKKTIATNFTVRINDTLGIIGYKNITIDKETTIHTLELERDIVAGGVLFGLITINHSTNSPYFFNFKTASNLTPANTKEIYALKISEIMTGKTGKSDDEFIELYNPTPFIINLAENDIRIYRASESGATSLVCNLNSSTHFINDKIPKFITIPPFGYYLLVNSNADESLLNIADGIIKDKRFCLTDNNSLFLTTEGSPTNPKNIIDLVGYGTATHFETKAVANVKIDGSIERKANEQSTQFTMRRGGYDKESGNSYDSQNNSKDFIEKNNPEPQNSRSAPEMYIQ